MKTLDEQATAALLPYAMLVPALAQAMRERRQGLIHAPPRSVLPLPEGGTYLAMSASDARLAITKLVSVTPANRHRGLPTLHGIVIVGDAITGRTLCALDGPTVTARRTAAVTLLGVETLLARAPRRIVLVGTGVQARAHAQAMAERWSPEVLRVVGRTEAGALAFARDLQDGGIAVHASAPPAAWDDAELVVCLTTSLEPVLPDDLPCEVMVAGIGAFTPAMAEIPPALARARRVVVDDLHGARDEAGDLLQAGIDWQQVLELADCLDHRPDAGAGFVLKTVGHATWDLAAARVAAGMS
jgi:ornithine cyclodeaminase/alanine dehydrogenase-like protein (mu-crystallin family)